MRVSIFCGLLFACLTAASSFAAEALLEDPLSSLGAWQAKPTEAASIDNGAAKLIVRNSSATLSRPLDVEAMAGKKIVFSVEAKGENIQLGDAIYCCGKIQVVYTTAGAKTPAFAAERVQGSFDWKPLELLVEFPKDLASAQVVLGLQETSGTIWFRNFKAAPLQADDSFPYTLPADLQSAPYQISVATSGARPLNPLIYGFNTNMSQPGVTYGAPEVRKEVSLLRPGVLRFPAGAIGNWYQWRTDDFRDIPKDAPAFARATAWFHEKGVKYGFDDYVKLVNEFQIEPIIMLNILNQSPQDAAAWFEDMKKKGFEPKKCELGNEIYLKGQSNEATRTVDGYIEVTKRFVAALREKNPELKIAVVCAPLGRSGASEEWNRKLAQERYYDAVVHHEYPGPSNDIFRKRAIEAYLAAEQGIDNTVEEFRQTFGDRPMWMTEWNLAIKGTGVFAHTGLHLLFDGARYLRMFDYPETLQLACYHVLCAGNFGPAAKGADGRFVKFPEFALMQLLGEATRECDEVLTTEVSPKQIEKWAFPIADAKAFRGKEDLRILVLNKLPVAKRVELMVDGKRWTGAGELATYSSRTLSEKRTFGLDEPMLKVSAFQGDCEVPPYSISRILVRNAD